VEDVDVTVSRAWKPENGKAYGTVVVRMAPDFERADARLWGIVEATDLTQQTSFDLLRIVGARNWNPRFDVLNTSQPWQTALGGLGGDTALAGFHALRSKLIIKRIEVFGVPGAGFYYDSCGPVRVDSALFDRTGWPVRGIHSPPAFGSTIRGVTSRDHWFSDRWGSHNQRRAVSLRRFEGQGVSARGELLMAEADYELVNYTHQGDGISFKLGGTNFRIAGFHGGPAFYAGVVPQNLIQFPDPVAYKHLHEAKNILTEDSVFSGLPFATLSSNAIIYCSYPFTEPPVFRRCTFIKGRHTYAFEVNWAAPRFEACEFIGWTDKAAAFQLSPAGDGLPPGTADVDTSCRFWDS